MQEASPGTSPSTLPTASERTAGWVVLEGVLFESGSKTGKRYKAEKQVLVTSTPVVLPGSVWYLVLILS